jgi:hypothetical protein
MEPLVDIGVRIAAQFQVDLARIFCLHHLDGAGVEMLADFDGHG